MLINVYWVVYFVDYDVIENDRFDVFPPLKKSFFVD